MQGLAIDDDRACTKCGYNLRGLTTSSRCPECGTPITTYGESTFTSSGIVRKKTRTMDFCDLPPAMIRKFSLGFYLAAISLLGILLLVFTSFRFGISGETYAATITALSFIWFPAVWLMTTPLDIPYEQRLGAPWELKVRVWARWLQLGWLLNAGIAWIELSTAAGGGAMFTVVELLTELAGIAGVALLCLLLANFSAWVRDDFAERCFNYAIGGMLIVTPVLFFGTTLVMTIMPMAIVFFIILWFVWVGAIFAFPVGLWSLGRSMSWAVRHSKDRIARATEVADSLAPEPPPGAGRVPEPGSDPIPLDDVVEPHDIRHANAYDKPSDPSASGHGMRRDRYDHERGATRGQTGETPQADLF